MIIHSNRIYLEDKCISGYIEIEDRIIKRIYSKTDSIKADIDYGNNRIIPGIFDTHNHGGFGYDMIRKTTKEDIKGYLPEDAVTYAINYEELGLNKKDVENGFKCVSADINILDPKIQEAIFKLQDNKFTADEIVNLYVNNVDITNEENIDKLIKDKNCNIDNLAKKNNEYRYNLQEYNCAVKPVSALVFANECKIRNNENLDAEKCRKDLGLPNIYDPERYGKLNSDFYKEYMDHLKKESDNENSISFMQTISTMSSTAGWLVAEGFDIGLELMQNSVQKISGIKDDAKNKQQRFNNNVTLNDVKKHLQNTNEQSSQNEVNEEINYAQSINLINMNNQNEK